MPATSITTQENDAAPSLAQPGTLAVTVRDDGVVEVTGTGRWTQRYADRHLAHLGHVIGRARRAAGVARVLVDLRPFAVQSSCVSERIRHWTGCIYAERDRVAILVSSSLLKAEMRQIAMTATRELFLSEAAARRWLMA